MGKIAKRINFNGWEYPPIITVVNSSCVQIFVGLIFMGAAFPRKVPYSKILSIGANFRILRHIQIVQKLKRTVGTFFLRLRDHPILSHTATIHLLRHSRCLCKHCTCVLSPWWWKKHAPSFEKFELVQRVFQGVWLEGPEKFWKLKVKIFTPKES